MKAMLDDGSYLFIPYADDGLDYCSASVVSADGTRTPHRPPDARSKCAAAWSQQDASKADGRAAGGDGIIGDVEAPGLRSRR